MKNYIVALLLIISCSAVSQNENGFNIQGKMYPFWYNKIEDSYVMIDNKQRYDIDSIGKYIIPNVTGK